jgi:hypothetical protein
VGGNPAVGNGNQPNSKIKELVPEHIGGNKSEIFRFGGNLGANFTKFGGNVRFWLRNGVFARANVQMLK